MADTDKSNKLTVDTDLEDIIVYEGYRTEKYTNWDSGTPYSGTREVPIIDVERTIQNLVDVINQLRREIALLKSTKN
ncbi:MAG: hypothetical protein Hyperionvirus5_99 [Hyperionvirus sp.]|uniref:Uncharacterized protein n=1 Tax=Hyperionvirus sp. TaxID=2487770 RepID=A0A3G5ABP1_9VIRU|nr:MAG: hypothetical protein Hyperionvirus5_99 [Hyperionvirus sp.]